MRHFSRRLVVQTGMAFGCVFLLAGCGAGEVKPPTSPVTGKVTYKGEAVKTGTVTFLPVKGSSTTAEIKPDGTYSMNAAQGASQVTIVSMEPEAPGAGGNPGQRKAPPKSLVPEAYGGPNSPLRVEVKAGPNKHDLELK